MPLDRLLNPTGFSVLTYSFIGIGEDEKENSYYLQDKPKDKIRQDKRQGIYKCNCKQVMAVVYAQAFHQVIGVFCHDQGICKRNHWNQ